MITEKHCHNCQTTKPASKFFRNKTRKDGLQTQCKPCMKSRNDSWYAKNTEYHNEYMRKHSKENRWIYNNRDARRRAAELKATPSWANLEQIERIYKLRKKVSDKTGVEHHVDHIIPLQGESICGLHVESNLAVVPARMNLSKGNSFGASNNNQEPT